jgi:hypothetical protein
MTENQIGGIIVVFFVLLAASLIGLAIILP